MGLDWENRVRAFRNTGTAAVVEALVKRRWIEVSGRFGGDTRGRLYSIHVRGLEHPVWVRHGTTDRRVFDLIFRDDEYGAFGRLDGIDWVVDCGANVGYSTVYFLNRYPGCRVVAVEPDPENYEALCRNVAPYGDRVRTVKAGVWSRPAGLVISEETFRDGGEWSVMVRESRPGEVPQVRAVDVPSLLGMTGAGRADILKMDVERSEKVIFAEQTEGWLRRVRNIFIELHDEECVGVFDRAVGTRPSLRKQHGELTFCQFPGVE